MLIIGFVLAPDQTRFASASPEMDESRWLAIILA